MHARLRSLMDVAPFATLLVLGLGLASPATAQAPAGSVAATTQEVKDLPLAPAQRQVYTGSYLINMPDGEQVTFRIFEEAGVLKGQPNDSDAKRLLYQGGNLFQPEGHPEMTLTFAVEKSRATRFTFTDSKENRTFVANRTQ